MKSFIFFSSFVVTSFWLSGNSTFAPFINVHFMFHIWSKKDADKKKRQNVQQIFWFSPVLFLNYFFVETLLFVSRCCKKKKKSFLAHFGKYLRSDVLQSFYFLFSLSFFLFLLVHFSLNPFRVTTRVQVSYLQLWCRHVVPSAQRETGSPIFCSTPNLCSLQKKKTWEVLTIFNDLTIFFWNKRQEKKNTEYMLNHY